MIADLPLYAAGVLMLAGTLFGVIGALGLVRLPDLYTRLHAASKAGLVGAGLVLFAVVFAAGDLAVALRAIMGIVFLALTTPISAHLLAKTAYSSGLAPHEITKINEMPKADR